LVPGVYTLTLANGLAFDPALHAVVVTPDPACVDFTGSATAGTEGELVITILNASTVATDCGFSFNLTAIPEDTTTTTTTTTTVAP
jgi:hypothetical protein